MKNILFISILLFLISCSKDLIEDQSVNTQDFIGTWIYTEATASFEIKIGAGPTVTSYAMIPAPGYTSDAKYSITSSILTGDKLFFVAVRETQFGDVVRECTCTLEDEHTLKVIQVLKINNVIKGSTELIYVRKT